MDGITVLNQTIIYKGLIPGWISLIVMGITIIMLLVGVYIYRDCERFSYCLITLGLLGCLTSVIIVVISMIPNKKKIDYIEYQVTIDNSVSFNDFNKKYSVLENNGKIYTVQER